MEDLVGKLRYGSRPDFSRLVITLKDDTATAKMPGASRSMNLVRVDGRWKIVPEKIAGGEAESRRLAALFAGRARAVRSVIARIGKPGDDIASLRGLLFTETGKALIAPR